MTGNLVADLIKKKDVILLDDEVQQGVSLHYIIDSYTDSHPVVSAATRLLHPTQGKYSPVATDLIWDLCLANHWNQYSQVPLQTFIQNVYSHLRSAGDRLEPKLSKRVNTMIDRDFLTMYTTSPKMKVICEKIHQRTRFKSNLHLLMDDYAKLQPEFDRLFLEFYPELSSHIDGWKTEIASRNGF